MRIITFNANGIRAAAKKGFFTWLEKQAADIICIQETKAQVEQLSDSIFHPNGYECSYNDAIKKGYSGVAIYSKQKPIKIIRELGWDIADTEGRYLQFDYANNLSVASLYLPSGGSSTERQAIKITFLDKYFQHLQNNLKSDRQYILCGDWNIAHNKIDLKNWQSNQKSSGFLPEERAWFTKMLSSGFIDAYRQFNPEKVAYTWWSNRANAWANNVGWRIDYQIISPSLSNLITKTDIYRAEKFSDHAPVSIDYDLIF